MSTFGWLKFEFCQRLGNSWWDLAVYCEIPNYIQERFKRGFEPQAILDWLESQHHFSELPVLL